MRIRYAFLLCSTLIMTAAVDAQPEAVGDTTLLKISKTAIGASAYSLYFATTAMNTLAADAYDTSRTADIKAVVQQSLDYFRAIKNSLDGLKAVSEERGRDSDVKWISKMRYGFDLLEKEAGLILRYIDAKTATQRAESVNSYRNHNAKMMDLLEQIMNGPMRNTLK